MNRILLSISTLIFGLNLFGQQGKRVETIPLEKNIEIVISSIDSTSLDFYDIYEFIYHTDNKEIYARFWANKNDMTFNLGKANLKLCRIIQMKLGDGINLRGCAFYNGITLLENDTIVENFDFDEFGESPTLRLCSTE